jgi:hypothetical protein
VLDSGGGAVWAIAIMMNGEDKIRTRANTLAAFTYPLAVKPNADLMPNRID